jgi:hypothetical protein
MNFSPLVQKSLNRKFAHHLIKGFSNGTKSNVKAAQFGSYGMVTSKKTNKQIPILIYRTMSNYF